MPQQQFEPIVPPEGGGDAESRRRLFASLYGELRRLAQRELRNKGSWLTLGATTLLHEVYLNLHERENAPFNDRGRFLAYASRAMRGLIVDFARSRQALKRGAAFEITALPTELPEQETGSAELQRLGDAVERLAAMEPRLAEVVDLKYFGGFSFGEIAAMLGMSERTVQRDWEKARLFLHHAVAGLAEPKP